MSTTITVPEGFHYLAPAFASTVILLFGQNVLVGRYRKRAKIEYPQMYAEKAEAAASRDAHLFNCAQRAHQNTLENIPIVYVTTLLTATKFPVFAATALGWWTLSRISYTRGYVTGDPKKRASIVYISGALFSLALLGASTYISAVPLIGELVAKLF